jgi:hypothetical protein
MEPTPVRSRVKERVRHQLSMLHQKDKYWTMPTDYAKILVVGDAGMFKLNVCWGERKTAVE